MQQNWHTDAFFGIHYDLHARQDDAVLGRDLSVEHLMERLARVKPDWIQCDCKGHPGWTSWPTKVGSTSPGLVKDSLAIHREATRKLGIRLGMHYSGVIDRRAVEFHPDWARIDADGNPSSRAATCPLGPYLTELMIPQLLEIIDTYDVDGFWVDGDNWASEPCWCPRCTHAYKQAYGRSEAPRAADHQHWEEWLEFGRNNFIEYVRAYTDAVHARKPDCLVCSNWMYTARQPEAIAAPVDYLSGDYKMDWGAERAAVEGRVLDARSDEISWDLMAWGFSRPQKNDTYFGLWHHKDALHLQQEVAEVVALGGAIMVYGKPERTGVLVEWHNEVIADVAAFCRARQEICHKTESASDVAILHLADSYYRNNTPLFNYGRAMDPVEGALHLLQETQKSTDILLQDHAAQRLHRYKLIVVPEQDAIPEDLQLALSRYVADGGHVVISGTAISHRHPSLIGAEPIGTPVESTAANRITLGDGSRTMAFSGSWQPVEPFDSTDVLRFGLTSQDPTAVDRTQALITRHIPDGAQGSVTGIHGPFFAGYGARHYPTQRRIFAGLIDSLSVGWSVEVEADPRLEIITRRRGTTLLVNCINRGAAETLSPTRPTVDSLLPVENVAIRVRREAPVESVTLEPSKTAVDWQQHDGVLTVSLPTVAIHEILLVQ